MASPALSSTTGVQPVPRPLGPVIVVMIHTAFRGNRAGVPRRVFPGPQARSCSPPTTFSQGADVRYRRSEC